MNVAVRKPIQSRVHEPSNNNNPTNSNEVHVPNDVAQEFQNSGVPYATMQQQPYYPYVYMYNVQTPGFPRNSSGNSANTRHSSSDSNQSPSGPGMNPPQSPMFFTPRSSPTGGRSIKTPLTSPLYQTPTNQHYSAGASVSGNTNYSPAAPAISPYYNNRATNTPGGAARRFQNNHSVTSPNAFSVTPQQQAQVPYFMNNASHPQQQPILSSGGIRSSTPPIQSARRSNESLNSPSSQRRPRREVSVSGASGVDWEVEGTSMTNLYIKGLKNSCTDDDLYNMCKVYGNIHSSKAILDLTTHECKGFGFVMYETMDESQLALHELSKLGYNVSFAKETFNTRLKNLQDEDSTNVYVSNLPIEMDEDGMFRLFAPHTIISTKILRDPATQQSRGVGFARMDSRAAAQAIITEFNGRPLDSGQCLQVRFADSAAQKKFKLMQQGLQPSPVRGSGSSANGGNSFASPTRGWRGDLNGGGSVGAAVKIPIMDDAHEAGVATSIEGGEPLSEDANANLGYVTYYDGAGYVPNGMMMQPGPYGYPVGPQPPHAPQIMNGAYYYPAPPQAGPPTTPQQSMMYGHPHPYMVPVYPAVVPSGGKPHTPVQEPVFGAVTSPEVVGVAVAEAAESGTNAVVNDEIAADLSTEMNALRV
ncbi:UNVERIFIED_CONTAM: hypothetical protein HDU68_003759 [Siphonaria sp. JEL0065]|nr:hypothetical protein HDU68_003759 [Siphonaria sp. JEL0065]